jgi:hypothetical protein
MLTKTRAREIDKGLGRHVEKFSRAIWPWRESWLIVLLGCLAIMDFLSTYVLLALSGKAGVYESGRLAGWALAKGGFPLLLVVDMLAVAVLSLVAAGSRFLYARRGYSDYGRAAFVFVLVPYIVIVVYAVVNNIGLLAR